MNILFMTLVDIETINSNLIAVVDNKFMFSGDTLLSIPTITRFRSGSTKLFWEEDIPKLKNKC